MSAESGLRLYAILLLAVISFGTFPSLQANRLSEHPSPYLRLHAEDPVDWRLWGPDLVDQARQSGRMIYLSIGYFSCHWCHVMQRESFQDDQVARFLNDNYLAVKIDRETHPELDRRMMAFVETVRGTAGWPLNVFLTPGGYPVTGFTYVPRDGFLDALKQLDRQWRTRRAEIEPAAREYFLESEHSETESTLVSLPDQHFGKLVETLVSQAMGIADELQGGFGDSSKFPSYPQLDALLTAIRLDPQLDPDVSEFVQLTLDSMAHRNLRDQVNGGFFRYTTDPDWQTPHFEKMLYDNAQLVLLYLDAARLWPGRGYANVALDTLRFMQVELATGGAGFSSSLSAVDEDNREGAAYLWTRDEIEAILSPGEISLMDRAGILPGSADQSLQVSGLQRLDPELARAIRQKLSNASRPLMPVDEKKLASWNALALLALLAAEAQDDSASLRDATDRQYAFIRDHLLRDGSVIRFAGAEQLAQTTLEDYAYVARAVARYAAQRDDGSARKLAHRLVQAAFDRYYQQGRWLRTTNSLVPGDQGAWVIQDEVLESPVSVLLDTAMSLPGLPQSLRRKADELISRLTRDMLDIPYHYASAIMLRARLQSKLDSNPSAGFAGSGES